ncbi:MAG: hypothetical protein N4A49_04990 [Marinifilaceae bacterium]|jgi:hypothetical protein|nr:hypothetical protein [Marinifilaceae bacterium]
MGTLILFLFVLAFSSINGFLPGTFFFLGIATALIFVLKNKLLGKSSLVINKLGISYNNKLFHWRSIEGIYMIDTDGTDSSDGETVMMILFRSGEQYNLDFNKMGFYTNLKLKKYIDTYRKSSLEYKE